MGSVVKRASLGAALCCVVLFVLLHARRNWSNVFFLGGINLQWYSIRHMRVTRRHQWWHITHDLQRIAQYSPIPRLTRTRIPTAPTHTYIPPTTGHQTQNYTSFVRTCCTLCLRALEHRPRLNVGIIVSVRTDDSPGNYIAMALAKLDVTMSPREICRSITGAVADVRSRPLERTLLQFLREWDANHIVFNNWRNIETMNQRSSDLRILTYGVTSFDITQRRQFRLSHDGFGWYIVSITRISFFRKNRRTAPILRFDSTFFRVT